MDAGAVLPNVSGPGTKHGPKALTLAAAIIANTISTDALGRNATIANALPVQQAKRKINGIWQTPTAMKDLGKLIHNCPHEVSV